MNWCFHARDYLIFWEIFENHGYMPKLFSGLFLRTTVVIWKSQPVVFMSEPAIMDWQFYSWLFDFSNI
jgi:uncharacterized membrane protein